MILVMPGAQYMTDEDAKMVGEENMRHSHATHDLFNEIKEGRYPRVDLWRPGQAANQIIISSIQRINPTPQVLHHLLTE